MIIREFVSKLEKRLQEPSPLIQVVLGPRQVGKTTGIQQLLSSFKKPSLYVSADDTLNASALWIQHQWQRAKEVGPGTLLVIDEIQKIPNWSEKMKRLWDEQPKKKMLKCVLLGSSSLSLQKGLTESLAGRFELITVPHWNYLESHKAFRYDLNQYLTFGGYPGANSFIEEYSRWFSYMKSSVVDMVIGQDILTQQTVAKPALFRQAFEILCGYPAQEVSYSTLLGQLHDRGNTDLVKHYLELYEGAFLFKGLEKYSAKHVKIKSSSPKIIPLCPAFYTLAAGQHALEKPEIKGHVFEAVVGTDLLRIPNAKVYYWRDGNSEVDFVVVYDSQTIAIEVKSGRTKSAKGLEAFSYRFPHTKSCFITWENYIEFATSPGEFLQKMKA